MFAIFAIALAFLCAQTQCYVTALLVFHLDEMGCDEKDKIYQRKIIEELNIELIWLQELAATMSH